MAHTVERLIWRKGFHPNQLAASTLRCQMELATQFAAYAACTDDLQALQRETCLVAAEGLKGSFAKLLVYQSNDHSFVLEAGVGWRSGIVGIARLDVDTNTTAGFAWQSGRPVIVNDLVYERRFRIPSGLAKHEITRCINVVIPGVLELAYGVLEVESAELGRFTAQDVSFLQLLAHSLTSAISRITLRARYRA